LTLNDCDFVKRLVSTTDGWIEFIGDRHVDTIDDAIAYIQQNIKYRKFILLGGAANG